MKPFVDERTFAFQCKNDDSTQVYRHCVTLHLPEAMNLNGYEVALLQWTLPERKYYLPAHSFSIELRDSTSLDVVTCKRLYFNDAYYKDFEHYLDAWLYQMDSDTIRWDYNENFVTLNSMVENTVLSILPDNVYSLEAIFGAARRDDKWTSSVDGVLNLPIPHMISKNILSIECDFIESNFFYTQRRPVLAHALLNAQSNFQDYMHPTYMPVKNNCHYFQSLNLYFYMNVNEPYNLTHDENIHLLLHFVKKYK